MTMKVQSLEPRASNSKLSLLLFLYIFVLVLILVLLVQKAESAISDALNTFKTQKRCLIFLCLKK